MIRRFRRWLRVVLPLDQLAYLVLAVLLALIAARAVRNRGPIDELATCQIFIVYGSTILYAAFRSIYFNPVEHRTHGNWLADTPWRHPQPLPLGPLHLVCQDVLLVALWSALLPTKTFSAWSVPILFLLVNSFCLSYSCCRMRIYQPVFVAGLLVGGFILALPNALSCMAFALAIYAATYWGLQQFLARLSDGEKMPPHLSFSLPTEQIEPLLGWPVPPVSTERYRWTVSPVDAVRVATVVGWLFFCIAWKFRETPDFKVGMARGLALIAMLLIVVRLWIYVVGYLPPISLLGRIVRGRWIIPGYDIVLVAPLAVLLVASVLPNAIVAAGISHIIATPMTAGAITWLALALPPSRHDWQLTGHHRIAYRLRASIYERNSASRMIPRTP